MEPEESQIESGFPLVSPILAMSAEFLVIFSQFLPNLCGRPPGGMHRAVYCSVPLSDWMALVMLVVLLFLIVHVICLLLLVPFSAKKKNILGGCSRIAETFLHVCFHDSILVLVVRDF